jgi:hypothetical protein
MGKIKKHKKRQVGTEEKEMKRQGKKKSMETKRKREVGKICAV